ncbi:ParB/RepB/Spo0J family partition protein [Legionella taurinensis]|uniref:Probable chromosome-partitioning protein ParB n=1 Tax=Legionella taurinensis TaxID=70611 RepID=A0A3A5LID0_9GAMM|nr:ParB/RepB/Spo0J family partition protein [Legionella taurinensis]MDX1836125.1 ParB/RepB/Spo0J family partition protein [Legionella taurinensis]PUT42102.1 chromosome partitioning protein ParB [Legionella taurinensis]PUT44889.1 chromosome partitioning protein ParB [Legionella taurinensis]PUT48210.1 chromosome partitioning protein ParB [Legionella taurinensis]PUT49024.1 chromosome partitioning protein ParB [Legionella taurinensis]
MAVKRGGLGRNLSVLLGQTAAPETKNPDSPLTLSPACLKPGKYQPRTDFSEDTLAELAESIRQQGLLQPLIVRPLNDQCYEIIAGERRWRASQLAGLTEVPVIVRTVDDETAMAIALIENLQREDLNALDQARAMHRLTHEFALTHQQVADLLAKSRTAVSNFLRLLTLSDEVKRLLEHGDLDMGHARALLILSDEQQNQAAQLIVAKNLSVRETEQLVKRIKEGKPQPSAVAIDVHPEVKNQLHHLSQQLKAKVKLKQGKSGKGSLVIHYNSDHELQAVLQQMLG